ncbi:hypothetical protein J7K91_02130 [bacterium]|nr:hypothetical protein [bacterium]
MVTISILRNQLACWYEFVSGEDGIILKVKKGYFENLLKEVSTLPEEWNVVKFLRKELLGNKIVKKRFCIGEEENLGFGGILSYQGEEEGFGKWFIPYPETIKFTQEECFYCKGSGKKGDEKCFWCRGTGREIEIEIEKPLAISASLMVITLILNLDPNLLLKDKKSSFPQPLTVNLFLSSSPYSQGAPIEGELGNELASFLKNHPRVKFLKKRIEEAMKRAYLKMAKPSEMDSKVFKAEVDKEGKVFVSFGIAGKYCGIFPSQLSLLPEFSPFFEKLEGYKFESRNTDSVIQQIVLLSSLAELTTIFHQAS